MNDNFRSQLSQLLSSGQFDAEWYVRRYPDVLQTGMGPAEHYLWLGKRMGRRGKAAHASDELIDIHAFMSREMKVLPSGPAQAEQTADIMIDMLAEWPGLDKSYVCYQLRIKPLQSARKVAELYYDEIKSRNILPNALFDPEYYIYYNDLNFRDDPIYHYITKGAKDHLNTHPLFDPEWYLTNYPEANDAPDLLVHYWECGYKDKILPVNPEKVPVLDQIRDIFFSDIFVDGDSDFDALIYRQFNGDLADLSDADLVAHFEREGRAEKRVAHLMSLFQDAGLPGHCIPINFDPKQYVSLHLDLDQEFGNNPWVSLSHYVRLGMNERRRYSFNQPGIARPLSLAANYEDAASPSEKTPLCVLVHLYYPEMWDELKPYISNIEVEFDLYVNLVESTWLGSVMGQVREDFPKARITISPNEGRDIGGFSRSSRASTFQSMSPSRCFTARRAHM